MIIRCKKTRRFLVNIDIDDYLSSLEMLGVKQERPLRITLPCPRCHEKESYLIYKDHYEYTKEVCPIMSTNELKPLKNNDIKVQRIK